MSRKRKGKLGGPYIPVMKRLLESPAWCAMSFGARALHTELRGRLRNDLSNNGQVYRSCRDAAQALGATTSSVVRWYAELEHYGFIRKTASGFLGIDGEGIAAKYRFTDLAHGTHSPTRDYEKWEGEMFEYEPRRKRIKKQNPVRKMRTPRTQNAHIGNPPTPASVCTQNAHIDSTRDRSQNAHVTRLPLAGTGLGRCYAGSSRGYRYELSGGGQQYVGQPEGKLSRGRAA